MREAGPAVAKAGPEPVGKELTEQQEKLLVSRKDAARSLSISKRAVDYLIANGELAVRRIGSRVLIPTNELRRFARGNHPGRLVE